MKLSELIKKLSSYLEEYGDLQVSFIDYLDIRHFKKGDLRRKKNYKEHKNICTGMLKAGKSLKIYLCGEDESPVEGWDTPSADEMRDYGYTWDGMIPISTNKALELWERENGPAPYRLYGDETEGMVESRQEIFDHAAKGGCFGVEKESLEDGYLL